MDVRAFTQVEQLRNLRGYAEYDRPNNKLYEFTGNLVLQGAQGAPARKAKPLCRLPR
jgi:hypothetical protein